MLINKPIYSETVIRVKCPSNIIFEAKFAPLDYLSSLVKLIKDVK
jgi:hypothetical protein